MTGWVGGCGGTSEGWEGTGGVNIDSKKRELCACGQLKKKQN